jgi:hypothetical protein
MKKKMPTDFTKGKQLAYQKQSQLPMELAQDKVSTIFVWKYLS